MGCDIHIVIERQNADGTWAEVSYSEDGTSTSPYFQQRHVRRMAKGAVEMPEVFTRRCYDLFGILANVRNGYGFAGTETGEAWMPLAPERGFPPDATRTIDEAWADDDDDSDDRVHLGDHSFTWIGLSELQAFDWDTCRHQAKGLVKVDEYQRWKASGDFQPKAWCGGITGPRVEIVSEPQGKALIASGRVHPDLYLECWWGETARQATNDWPGRVLPRLTEIAGDRPLRLLLSFDS